MSTAARVERALDAGRLGQILVVICEGRENEGDLQAEPPGPEVPPS